MEKVQNAGVGLLGILSMVGLTDQATQTTFSAVHASYTIQCGTEEWYSSTFCGSNLTRQVFLIHVNFFQNRGELTEGGDSWVSTKNFIYFKPFTLLRWLNYIFSH